MFTLQVKSTLAPESFLVTATGVNPFVCCSLSTTCKCREVRGWDEGGGGREGFVSPSDNPCIDKDSSNMQVEHKHHITVWNSSYLSPSIHLPSPTAPPSLLWLLFSVVSSTLQIPSAENITRSLSRQRSIIFSAEAAVAFLSGLFLNESVSLCSFIMSLH